MILALETATNICSVSFKDRKGKIHEKRMERRGSHSEYLFIFIRELMAEHNFTIEELDAVLVSNGPGSYTGLRIAASAVKGLLFNLDVDLYAANTLAGFALGAHQNNTQKAETDFFDHSIHAVINARRSHLYHQQFNVDGSLQNITKPEVLELKEIEKMIQPNDILVGTGIDRLSDEVRKGTTNYGLDSISASSLIQLFDSESRNEFFTKTTAEQLESNYISSSQV